MRLLVLGGSVFLGRAAVEAALAAGHEVTTFNRGVSGSDHPRAAAIRGDRTDPDDLRRLAEVEPWDAVIDTSPQVPRDVLASAEALSGVRRYVLVTSVSVYPGWPAERVGSSSATFAGAPDAGPDDGHYGELKAGCERAATQVLGERAVIVRPGVILGPHENVGRLPWWLRRMARGGEVLVPGAATAPFQAVDVRDLADLLVAAAARPDPPPGPLVAPGPVGRDTYGDWLELCHAAAGPEARLVWVDDDFLSEHGVEPWGELPLWLPPGPDTAHAFDVDGSSATDWGLSYRPLADTVTDTWAWLHEEPGYAVPERTGLDPVKEQVVLDAWVARS
jgi:2'-hydroxyisoflavone reductase